MKSPILVLLLLFVGVIAQNGNTIKNTHQEVAGTQSVNMQPQNSSDSRVKDSMLEEANKNLDVAISITAKIPKKKEELLRAKLLEQKAMREYIATVDAYLKKNGRNEKVILKNSSLKQQLNSGEIFLVRDSTCIKEKRRFLGKKKCIDWVYNYYLQDKDGNKEKLF